MGLSSHFPMAGVVLIPKRAACQMWRDRKCLGETLAKAVGLDRVGQLGGPRGGQDKCLPF